MEAIREQRAREPIGEGAKPTLKWATTAPKPRLEDYTVDDFLVEDYRHHGKVVMTVK
jgi:thymidylate synthase